MKKRILFLLLAAFMLVCALGALTACGEEACQHVDISPKDGKCDKCGTTLQADACANGHTYEFDCSEECLVCGKKRSVSSSKHAWEYKCDTECDDCGKTRTVSASAHEYKYDCSDKCENCGEKRNVDDDDHIYDNACDATCNECGKTRSVPQHVYDYACDKDCNVCGATRIGGAHVYDNECDKTCNNCGESRTVDGHVYDNACDRDCNECGKTRSVGAHRYDNACDYDCNECGATRSVPAHRYDNDCDTDCNVCGATRSTMHVDSNPKDGFCDKCYATIDYSDPCALGHTYDNDCDPECNICQTTRTVAHIDIAPRDGRCDVCSTVTDKCLANGHTYDNACDKTCNVCNKPRTVGAHVDSDSDGMCDECDTVMDECLANGHKDPNTDGSCDVCGSALTCIHTYDNACDTDCNKCGETRTVGDHVDSDGNLLCDECGATVDPCANGCVKKNDDQDGKCDYCGKVIQHKCIDDNGDKKCDVCSKRIKEEEEEDDYPPVAWKDDEPIKLFFMMTKNTDNKLNPSGCERYLAGEDNSVTENIDSQVATRNYNAAYKTNVEVSYSYYDDVTEYGWGKCIEIIYKNVESGSTTAPDMYCNFTYDMVGASIKGSFANLKNTTLDRGNYFQFLDDDYDETVDNKGYMFDYMQSTTLSEEKMYILASDYFIDLVRSFFIVPVDISLLETYGDGITADYDGNGKITIDDFYEEVNEKKWTYQKVIDYSAKVYYNEGTTNAGEDIEDLLGFALAQDGLTASGVLYSTNITVIEKPSADNDYQYSYPAEGGNLQELFDNVKKLVDAKGVVSIADDSLSKKYGATPSIAIRNRFCESKILFGGVIVLGALEFDAYQRLKENSGFGVVPVPLYHEVAPDSDENYLTSIHNNARPGGIAKNTKNFSACTAFLDYQSTHSTDILTEYYDYNLQYNVVDGAVEGTVTMLQYIRKNVRSAFDKTFEDAVGVYGADKKIRWHTLLEQNSYSYDIRTTYTTHAGTKQGFLNKLYAEYPKLP